MRRLLGLIALSVLLAAAIPAADLSGVWKGQFDFGGQPVPVTLTMKVAGDALTGKVEGLQTTPVEMQEGKIAGDSVTFWITTDYQGTNYKIVYKGKVAGDEIRFTFGTEDGSWGAEMVVKRT